MSGTGDPLLRQRLIVTRHGLRTAAYRCRGLEGSFRDAKLFSKLRSGKGQHDRVIREETQMHSPRRCGSHHLTSNRVRIGNGRCLDRNHGAETPQIT